MRDNDRARYRHLARFNHMLVNLVHTAGPRYTQLMLESMNELHPLLGR